jgi:hypothetical protein
MLFIWPDVACYKVLIFTIIQQETNVKRLELKLKTVTKKLSCGGVYEVSFDWTLVRERYFFSINW